jgi:hypothetical protein
MVRSIIAVIVSYLVMFILSFIAFTCVYLVLQADGSFKPGLFEASNLWIGIALCVNLIAAIIGGLVCAAISKSSRAPIALAIVVIVIGLVLGVFSIAAQKANAGLVRHGEVPMMEAMQKAQQPVWVHTTFPLLVAMGVVIGGRLRRRS